MPRTTERPNILIRPLSDEDAACVLRINADNHPAVATLDDSELRRLRGIGGRHLVAIGAHRSVVGYLLTFTNTDPYDGEEFRHFVKEMTGAFLYIDQVAVDRTHRRYGIGRKLYRAVTDLASAEGVCSVCAEVNTVPDNPISLGFHKALGFRQIGARVARDGRTVMLLSREG